MRKVTLPNQQEEVRVQPQQKWEGVRPAACAECTRVPLGVGPWLEPHIPQHPSLSLCNRQNQLALNRPPHHHHFCQLAIS